MPEPPSSNNVYCLYKENLLQYEFTMYTKHDKKTNRPYTY